MTGNEANPRFVDTSLKPKEAAARQPYEKIYCARSEVENRIKECQLDLSPTARRRRACRPHQLRTVVRLDGLRTALRLLLPLR